MLTKQPYCVACTYAKIPTTEEPCSLCDQGSAWISALAAPASTQPRPHSDFSAAQIEEIRAEARKIVQEVLGTAVFEVRSIDHTSDPCDPIDYDE